MLRRFLVLCLALAAVRTPAAAAAASPRDEPAQAGHPSGTPPGQVPPAPVPPVSVPPASKPTPPVAAPPTPSTRPADPRAAEDARARDAFARLSPEQRRDFADYLESEINGLGTFQVGLVTWVLRHQDRDPSSWKAIAPAPFFDPHEHAPAQPIARTRLDPDSAEAVAARRSLLARGPERRLAAGFAYDYATGDLVRLPCADEAARAFENALAGYPPRLDLAEALVERALDDGSQRAAAAAFAHAYTDRSGKVYPGITLYDAHASGAEIEMPDVDTLGIVHALMPGNETWKAPVPGPLQGSLYEAIGERFRLLHHHRSLRHALAMTCMNGSETLRDGYGPARDNLHALWEECASTPETMLARLPAASAWAEFLAAWAKRCSEADSPFQAGVRRRQTLDAEAAAVRACVLHGLVEFGVLEAPATPRATSGTSDGGKPPGDK